MKYLYYLVVNSKISNNTIENEIGAIENDNE